MLFEAISGVDIALWDILGKVAGLPIHRLLGGMGRTEVPVYAASVNWGSDEFMDRELDSHLEKGFARIKVKVANPVRMPAGASPAGASGPAMTSNSASMPIGPIRWKRRSKVGRALSDNALFLVRGAAAARGRGRLRGASPPMRHAACSRRKQLYARSGDAARRQPDALPTSSRTLAPVPGGISETRRMAESAAAHDVWMRAPYRHVRHRLRNGERASCRGDAEYSRHGMRDRFQSVQDRADRRCAPAQTGRRTAMPVPTGPGLGIEIDWDAVARLRA